MKDKGRSKGVSEVSPETVKKVTSVAEAEGLSKKVAKEVINDAVDEGVAPEKIEEVATEAVRVEREDQQQK